MRDALRVDTPTGERWSLALDLLRNGGGAVRIENLVLYRDLRVAVDDFGANTGGGAAEKRIEIEVITTRERPSERDAHASVDHGRQVVAELAEESPEFGTLLEESGCIWSYVFDDDYTRVRLARVTDDGQVLWTGTPPPPGVNRPGFGRGSGY